MNAQYQSSSCALQTVYCILWAYHHDVCLFRVANQKYFMQLCDNRTFVIASIYLAVNCPLRGQEDVATDTSTSFVLFAVPMVFTNSSKNSYIYMYVRIITNSV